MQNKTLQILKLADQFYQNCLQLEKFAKIYDEYVKSSLDFVKVKNKF